LFVNFNASACILIGLVNDSALSSLEESSVIHFDLARFFAAEKPQVIENNISAGLFTAKSLSILGSSDIFFNSLDIDSDINLLSSVV
jgi:hypothetical protein